VADGRSFEAVYLFAVGGYVMLWQPAAVCLARRQTAEELTCCYREKIDMLSLSERSAWNYFG